MGQRNSQPSVSDSIDEFFEPLPGDVIDDMFDEDEPFVPAKSRLAELRRRAELRLEAKRIREELDYLELDWEEA